MDDKHNKSSEILEKANSMRLEFNDNIHDILLESIYEDAGRIAGQVVSTPEKKSTLHWDKALDKALTSRVWGLPIMLALLAGVFWITITGANYPSQLLARLLLEILHPALKNLVGGWPWWLSGVLIDGMYLASAWVVSVMLPPMAIFFPLFTLLEDFGYLPRVAFNMDGIFRKAGAHGKQALSMAMGYGCNAAGIIATRIIDSPRERLIAIITNNFAVCNGRWPTQILVATLFIGPLAPAGFGGLLSAGAVMFVVLLGIFLTFAVSWELSRTILKGEVSTFSLELPPYRPPRILRTLYTSLLDRTIFVLWRAILFAVPAGAVIWLLANIPAGPVSLAEQISDFLNPFGMFIGLNGIILLAYIIAIPANEIVIPTVLMLTVLKMGVSHIGAGAGVMFELDDNTTMLGLFHDNGWNLLTAINLMLFSLIHNPCSTTIYTIYKETNSGKWTALSAFLPLFLGLVVCLMVAVVWRWVSGS